jgi:hypothetical protein
MTTFCKSNISEASYSMLTLVVFPDTEGQQLTTMAKNRLYKSKIASYENQKETAVYLSMAEKIHPTPRFSTSPDLFHFHHWGKAG